MLLYAYNASAQEHAQAKTWWERCLSESEVVGLCWQTITAFIRIGTNPRAYEHPLSILEAVRIVQSWVEQPNVQIISPGQRHWEILQMLLVEAQATGALVMDAHLAALALENGATLCTRDADFSRFSRLRYLNPISA